MCVKGKVLTAVLRRLKGETKRIFHILKLCFVIGSREADMREEKKREVSEVGCAGMDLR